MAGIIETAATGKGRQATGKSLQSQLQVPPEKKNNLDRLILAGKKLLFSEQLAPEVAQLVQGPGDMPTKLSQGVMALLAILLSKGNGAIPPDLIIPAGVALVGEAGDMLEEAGAEITDAEVAEGIAMLIEEIMSRAGVTPDQLPQLLQQGGGAGGPQPTPQAAPQGAPQVAPDGMPVQPGV